MTDEVKDAIKILKMKFNGLKKKILESLNKHKVKVADVADALTLLSPNDDECHQIFLEEHIKNFNTAVNNFELFMTMNFHWNYLDPSLLNNLVTKLKLVEVKPDMTTYQSELQQFRMKTPLNLFCQTQRRINVELSPQVRKMVTKCNWPNDVSLEVLEQFRQEYASHYKLRDFARMVNDVLITGMLSAIQYFGLKNYP